MASKFEWDEANAITPITMEDIVCKDCFHRGGRTDMCGAFPNVKPLKVLKGGECKYYKRDT